MNRIRTGLAATFAVLLLAANAGSHNSRDGEMNSSDV
jgi:hypothetical protein